MYPNLTTSFSFDHCPSFWQKNKIKIKLLDLREKGYMENIASSAYVAIGIDLFVGISFFVLIWRKSNLKAVYMKSKDELGPWVLFGRCSVGPFRFFTGFGKIRFMLTKIIIGFGMPLIDTISGASNPFLSSNSLIRNYE